LIIYINNNENNVFKPPYNQINNKVVVFITKNKNIISENEVLEDEIYWKC